MKRNQVSYHPEPFFNQRKAECKRTQQLPTLLRQQCWELFRACWQWCANGCNNSQQCWDQQCIVGRIQPISLCKPCVMSVRDPNNVGRAVQTDPTLLRHASAITVQKKMLGVVGWIVWPVSNFAKQHSTTCNRVCKRTQHVTSNNVASFARGLKPKVGVVGSVAGWLLCCGVGTVHCLFNLLYDVIWWLHPSATPSNYLKSLTSVVE